MPERLENFLKVELASFAIPKFAQSNAASLSISMA